MDEVASGRIGTMVGSETLSLGLMSQLSTDQRIRMQVAAESHYWFFHLYLSRYVKHETAPFQQEIFALTQDPNLKHVCIVAFRGSGKSTIVTLSYPIWAVLGIQQKKFVLILSQTQAQAKMHLINIKREFESNEILRKDFGPLEETSDEWGSTSLVLTKYGARISAASSDQSIRGIRHGENRPDLIIADDVEDMMSTKTREGRNKTFDWFTGEVLPVGDQGTKIVTVGNLLHEDSLLMRLKERIAKDEIDGTYREWPIVQAGESLWPGKYPDHASLNVLRRSVGNRIAWEREYLLRIIPDEDQVIDARWIQYYDELPPKNKENEYINSFLSVDLAISQSATADYTAIILIHVYGYKPEDRSYYIDKRFVNKKLTHMATLDTIATMYAGLNSDSDQKPRVLVEQVQYQAAVVEQLKDRDVKTKGIKIHSDKRARLQLASALFEQGKVYFPKDPIVAPIIHQLVGFGVEKHDDLADAVSMGLNYIQTNVKWEVVFGFGFIGGTDDELHEFYGIRYRDEEKKKG